MAAALDIVVDGLRPAEIEAGAALLARSFKDEPLFKHVFAGETVKREKTLGLLFQATLDHHLKLCEVKAARVDGRLAGLSIAMGPGSYLLVRRRRSLTRLLSAVRLMLAYPAGGRRLKRVADELNTRHPQEPEHWYIRLIGVEPALQGQGIGSRLVEELKTQADADGLGCYLETFDRATADFYGRRGFLVQEMLRPLDNGPTCYMMWREPQRSSGG
jgi:GNAT superfamily N-acetyltransferase